MVLEIIIIISIVAILVICARKIPNMLNTGVSKPSISIKKPFLVKEKRQVLEDDNVGSDMEKADFLFEHKNFKEAEELYIKLISNDPKNPRLYNRLGALYLETKNFSDAKSAFSEALKYDQTKASRFYNFALSCAELKEYNNAIEALEKAIKLDNKNKKYSQLMKDIKKRLS